MTSHTALKTTTIMKNFYLLTLLFLFSKIYAQEVEYECVTQPLSGAKLENYVRTIQGITVTKTGKTRAISTDVPVQIHLFTTAAGVSNITMADIRRELDSVNILYQDAGIRFVECGQPDIIAVDSLYNYNTDQEAYIFANFYTNNVINLYFPNTVTYYGFGVCGYSAFPPSSDFVFVESGCGKNGSTLAHELGHYFNLPHTHDPVNGIDELVDGSNCTVGGDLICDTPADPNLSGVVDASCNYIGIYTDANNMTYNPDATLLMSYARKSCRKLFTPMQSALMNYTLFNDRTNLDCAGFLSTNDLNEDESILVFPNPASNFVTVEAKDRNIENIKIMDIQEKVVYERNAVSKNEKIDVSNFVNGYYFIQVQAANYFSSKPLVIIQ